MGTLASIVVPVFNGMPHLGDLVECVLAQDYPDLEIVFSDGGSTDGSCELLEGLTDPRVRLMTIPAGSGAAANWTAVTQAATGEFVKLVCQDDLLRPDAVSQQVEDLHVHPTALMAVAQRDIVDANGDVLYPRRGGAGLTAGSMPGSEVIRACWQQGTNVVGEPLAVLFRREPLRASMPWDDSDPLVLDLRMYAKVAALGDIAVRKHSIGAFRVSTSSWSTRLAGVQRQQFERWQQEYEESLPAPLSRWEVTRARAGLHVQTTLRRGAYAWLRTKGSFHSS